MLDFKGDTKRGKVVGRCYAGKGEKGGRERPLIYFQTGIPRKKMNEWERTMWTGKWILYYSCVLNLSETGVSLDGVTHLALTTPTSPWSLLRPLDWMEPFQAPRNLIDPSTLDTSPDLWTHIQS